MRFARANVFASVAVLLTLLMPGLQVAKAQSVFVPQADYCLSTTGACYRSLEDAEAAMRAQSVYGNLIREKSIDISSGTSTGVIYYHVPDQPPTVVRAPIYRAGRIAFTAIDCANSDPRHTPSRGYGCDDVGAAVQIWLPTAIASMGLGGNCHVSGAPQIRGTHPDLNRPQFYDRWDVWGDLHYGVVTGTGSGTNDSPTMAEYDQYRVVAPITCDGGTGPNVIFAAIDSHVSFDCPVNFSPIEAGFSDGTPLAEKPLCRPTNGVPYITLKVRKVDSCPTRNPCHPATGDKSRAESDFDFAGRPFTRHYHSLKEYSGFGFGIGWSHTYSERIIKSASTFYLINGNGTYEAIKLIAGNLYRAENSRERTVEIVSQGAVAYRLLDASGELREFNASGLLLAIKHPENPAGDVSLSYNGTQLATITDHSGRTLAFIYQAGKISAISLPDGSNAAYSYDAFENLVLATLPGGSKQYHYAENGLALPKFRNHLTGITYEDGIRYASFGYDEYGRVTSSALAGGSGVDGVTLRYDSSTQVSVTTASGDTDIYTMESGTYRRVTSVASLAGNTSSTFDALGRLATATDRRGIVTKYEYPSQTSRAVTRAFGTTAQQRTETDLGGLANPLERRALNAAAALVAKSNWMYNSRGQVLTATQTDPASGAARTTTSTWCEQINVDAGACPRIGLLTSVNGPRTDIADVTNFSYYTSDDPACATAPTTCPHRKGDLWKATNALGQTTETLMYDGAGRPLSVKDANGVVTEMTYHPRGWLTSRTVRAATTADDRDMLIDYWPTGLVKKVTQADGSFTAYTYDAAHRLTDITDSAGNTIHYTLDNAGNRTGEDTRDPNGALTRTLSRLYNQLGQLQSQSDAEQHATGYSYDGNGNTTGIGDALGRGTGNTYDPLNRLSKTIQDTAGIAATTQFQYDALDNLTKVIDPQGLATDYSYNGLGDLTQLVSPDTGTTGYTYDSAGNRKTQTDARGVTATYNYDATNRLTGIVYPTTSLNIGYQYDTVNAACISGETFAKGRITQITDASGSTLYCYTRFGELARKVQLTNGKTFVTRYGYDVAGRLATLIYPDGALADYVRDGEGRVAALGITSPGGARKVVVTGASYAPFGPSTGWTYGNGRTLTRGLNLNYQPQAILDAGAGGLSLSFGFDPVGNMTLLQNATQTTALARYGYDGLNRLQQTKDGPTGTPIETYGYDATGNRLSVLNAGVTKTYAYPVTSHRLSSVASVARTYDTAGNTTRIGTGPTLVYNDTNRLSQLKNGNKVAMNYVYNGKGEQVRRYVSSKDNSYFVYDEAGHLLGEYDNGGAPVQQILWLDDLPVGVLAGSGTSQKLHYIEPDHLGTPRVIIDGARNVAIWKWDLQGEAFGASPPNQNPDGDATQFVFNLRYSGQRYDSATGMNYNYFRDYDPSTGRYVESDPIGLRGGFATYGYAGQSPLTSIDPKGLAIWEVTDGLEGGMVMGIGGQYATYNLTSPCGSDGNRYKITVHAVGPSSGAELKCKFCFTAPFKIVSAGKFDDHSVEPDPNAFNGPYLSVSVGAQIFGFHWAPFGDTLLGRATSVGGSGIGYGFGAFGAGASGTIGTSTVTAVQKESCACSAK